METFKTFYDASHNFTGRAHINQAFPGETGLYDYPKWDGVKAYTNWPFEFFSINYAELAFAYF